MSGLARPRARSQSFPRHFPTRLGGVLGARLISTGSCWEDVSPTDDLGKGPRLMLKTSVAKAGLGLLGSVCPATWSTSGFLRGLRASCPTACSQLCPPRPQARASWSVVRREAGTEFLHVSGPRVPSHMSSECSGGVCGGCCRPLSPTGTGVHRL